MTAVRDDNETNQTAKFWGRRARKVLNVDFVSGYGRVIRGGMDYTGKDRALIAIDEGPHGGI